MSAAGAAFFLPGADPIWSEPEPESDPGPRTSGAAKNRYQKRGMHHASCVNYEAKIEVGAGTRVGPK